METILLSLILVIGLAVLYFQIKNKPKQDENVSEKFKDEINSIKIPVCVVWGKEDQIIPSNHHQVLNDKIKIIIEKDCGHMAHIEKPSVVNNAINSTIVG